MTFAFLLLFHHFSEEKVREKIKVRTYRSHVMNKNKSAFQIW